MARRARLFVEGIDDAHAIRNVLWNHGWDEGKIGIQSLGRKVASEPLVIDPTGGRAASGNDELALLAFGVELETAESAVGIVLDADEDRKVAQRWDQVRSVLEPLGVATPREIDPSGFVGVYRVGTIEVAVGVWLMRTTGGKVASRSSWPISRRLTSIVLFCSTPSPRPKR